MPDWKSSGIFLYLLIDALFRREIQIIFFFTYIYHLRAKLIAPASTKKCRFVFSPDKKNDAFAASLTVNRDALGDDDLRAAERVRPADIRIENNRVSRIRRRDRFAQAAILRVARAVVAVA